MAKKVQFTTNQPSASTDYLAADNTWKTMSGGGGSTTWGSITGTLSSQTDLQTALDAKMNIATYDTDVDGVVDSSERIQIVVRNSTGSTLSKGQIVYLSGATGNRPNALLAQANTEATSSKTIGMVIADIPNNTDGQIAVNGTLHDIDTSSFTAGDSLWLSAITAGGMVANTPPTEPNHAVFIGYVARAHPTQGRVVLNVQNGYELDELHGVQITSVANNDILKYNSSNSLWENSNVLSTKQDTITGAATTVTTTDLTGSRVLVSNPGGKIAVSGILTTELGYLSGVTSDIQPQLNNKQTTVSLTTTGTSGAATFNSSTGALNIPQYSNGYGLNLIQKAAYGYEYYNDFLNLSANILTGFSDGNGIQAAFSGTGTTVTSNIAPAVRATNQHGFMQPTTGSTASSHAGVHMSISTALLLGGGAMTFNTSVLFNTASTSTERYRAVIGYANTVTNGQESNGIFFTYDEGGTGNGTAASPNWQCLTIAGSVRTLTTTSTAVSFTAWQKLSIEINAAGTSVQFFVDNTLVATHTTNIPSGTSQLVVPKIFIVKTIGTTSRYYHCDYIYYSQTYTTQKPV